MHFRKAVLKPGTYHSPDGAVSVDAAKLAHWRDTFQRMKAAKQVIPIDWDHATSADKLVPLSLSDYKRARSARNTVGHLVDMKILPGDAGAELTLEIGDAVAAEKAEKNLVYVSPVIFPKWRDGAGTEYADCVTHVDLVNHPVDHSQGPFVPAESGAIACAIRMGLGAPYRLGDVMDDDDKAGNGDETLEEIGDGDGDGDGVANEGTPEETAAAGVNDDAGKLADVIKALAGMNIVLSPDTTTANFLQHVHQALLTAAAHRGEANGNQTAAAPGAADGAGPTTVADPGMAVFSLEQRQQLEWADKQHREGVAARLKRVLENGQCTPAESEAMKRHLPAVKLSLGGDGKPVPSRLEDWLAARESVPAGTFWDSATRLALAGTPSPVPSDIGLPFGADDVKKTVDWVLGRK